MLCLVLLDRFMWSYGLSVLRKIVMQRGEHFSSKDSQFNSSDICLRQHYLLHSSTCIGIITTKAPRYLRLIRKAKELLFTIYKKKYGIILPFNITFDSNLNLLRKVFAILQIKFIIIIRSSHAPPLGI